MAGFKQKVRATWQPVSFTCTELALLSRTAGAKGEPYRAVHRFVLGSGEEDAENLEALVAAMVLEPPSRRSRLLKPYMPLDRLERWMLGVSDGGQALANPTHISQRGAMYHVPDYLLHSYLDAWAASVAAAKGMPGVKFFMEELRGPVFRLYLDVDVKRTCEEPYHGDLLIR